VVLGALGKREEELGGDTRLNDAERATVRRQAIRVVEQAALIAVVAAGVVWLL
jgi:hypothetical protein